MAAMMAAEAVTAAPLEPRTPNVSYLSGFNLGANKVMCSFIYAYIVC